MAEAAREPVLIIGAGISGLACALHLHERDVPVQVLEDEVGGRMRTDVVDGFLLDRGFQVLLTAYPEVRRMLDLEALQLGAFAPAGSSLVSATVMSPWTDESDETLQRSVREQLTRWFGPEVKQWRELGVVRVAEALPHQPPGPNEPSARPCRLDDHVYVCGDYRDLASINGALVAGRRAAEEAAEALAA